MPGSRCIGYTFEIWKFSLHGTQIKHPVIGVIAVCSQPCTFPCASNFSAFTINNGPLFLHHRDICISTSYINKIVSKSLKKYSPKRFWRNMLSSLGDI